MAKFYLEDKNLPSIEWFDNEAAALAHRALFNPKGEVTCEMTSDEARVIARGLTDIHSVEEVQMGKWTFRACAVKASTDSSTYGVPIDGPIGDRKWFKTTWDYGTWWLRESMNMVAVFGSFNGGRYKVY